MKKLQLMTIDEIATELDKNYSDMLVDKTHNSFFYEDDAGKVFVQDKWYSLVKDIAEDLLSDPAYDITDMDQLAEEVASQLEDQEFVEPKAYLLAY